MRKFVIRFLSFSVVLVALSPGALYLWGMSGIDPPEPDAKCMIKQKFLAEVWEEFHEESTEVEVEVLNPWSFMVRLYFAKDAREFRGYNLASFLAEEYAPPRRTGQPAKNLISRISLAIWFTRNWSSEEMLCRCAGLLNEQPET